jgi:hypothetical protein
MLLPLHQNAGQNHDTADNVAQLKYLEAAVINPICLGEKLR